MMHETRGRKATSPDQGSIPLDTQGLYCPVPILRTRQRLRSLPEGAVLEILSDDPVILEDMPAFCRAHGHRYLGHELAEEGVWRVRIQKGESRGDQGK